MNLFRTASLLAISGLSTSAIAQADWTALAPATSPSPRAGVTGVTDGNVCMIFGGKPNSTSELNDLWSFDGANWTDITPTTGPLPPARDWYGLAFDSGRSRLVLFGGRSTALAADLGDTWEFDGTVWNPLTPGSAPSIRRWTVMTYDASRNETILFGGANGSTYYNDTWSWNGSNWTALSPATSPSIRGRGALTYDPSRQEMIYYGGRNAAGALAETWRWDGSTWTQIPTTTAPGSGGVGGLFAFAMTYDEVRDRHVIFGGTRTGGTLAGTWEFDGADWAQRSPANVPASRTVPSLTFVPALGKSILFGGFQSTQLSDTWEYQTSPPASATDLGTGCSGSGGQLTLSADSMPWLGDTFSATATNTAAGSLVFELTSLSHTLFSGGALPAPLSGLHPAGGAGCDLLVGDDIVTFRGSGGAPIVLSTTLPAVAAFINLPINKQVLSIELAGAGIGFIGSSNGIEFRCGLR
ncbi:MAG: hypothetical protein KDC98_12235 [Planctomycetes bacterium]|nr:hypothetical protein [Planctomycetota bacterium]